MPKIIILISKNSLINHLLPHEYVMYYWNLKTKHIGPFSEFYYSFQKKTKKNVVQNLFLYFLCSPVWFMMLYLKMFLKSKQFAQIFCLIQFNVCTLQIYQEFNVCVMKCN